MITLFCCAFVQEFIVRWQVIDAESDDVLNRMHIGMCVKNNLLYIHIGL